MANSPRPGVWILERSKDYGKTFTPWQFFADTDADCQSIFGTSSKTIERDDSVICETRFSKLIPLEDGEIVVSLMNRRPSAANFSASIALQEFTKATTVRLRLLRPKTTLGHLTSINRQDPTITRRYFYSIKDINIGGLCVCHGHASLCGITDPAQPHKLDCKCEHNTCGSRCEKCCDGFVQKKWHPATLDNPFVCEACNCHGHSDKCYYDEKIDAQKLSLDIHGQYDGGGVCIDCEDNTQGINCHECKDTFYRPFGRPLNASNVCEPCQCNPMIHNGSCAAGTGKCYCRPEFKEPDCNPCAYGFTGYPECKPCHCFPNGTENELCQPDDLTIPCPCKVEYSGRHCNSCSEGHFGYPDCKHCSCDGAGAVSKNCNNVTGQCECSNGFSGRTCDRCEVGYSGYPRCNYCDCDRSGTTNEVCDSRTGQCLCKPGYAGRRCDQCDSRYHGFPNCTSCNCNPTGSVSLECAANGKCRCLPAFGGLKCADCSVGHYKYPECLPCACQTDGSHGTSCDNEGNCICKKEFDGAKCGKCKEGYYNHPRCEACNCDPAGVSESFKGCDTVSSGELCKCKERVTGRTCNLCKDLYWNLKSNNPLACEDCRCNRAATVSNLGNCESLTGQCVCKANTDGRICDSCKEDTFALSEGNLFGCTNCQCDIGGSYRSDGQESSCDHLTGQCSCKPKVTGRQCDKPLTTYYYPTLYQYLYELEDGKTRSNAPARFGYDENVFPNYSWKGYANFTSIMRQVNWEIYVFKPSFYRLVFRYVNLNNEPVAGQITFTPDLTQEEPQSAKAWLPPASTPRTDFASNRQNQVNQVILNPGKWNASLKVDKDILIDYMVIIPEAYYEATLLKQLDPPACLDEEKDDVTLCSHYAYPPLPLDDSLSINKPQGQGRPSLESKKFSDRNMALMNSQAANRDLRLDLNVPRDDDYVLLVQYHNPNDPSAPKNEPARVSVKVDSTSPSVNDASENLNPATAIALADCPYDLICRHVVSREANGEVINYRLAPGSSMSLTVVDMIDDRDLMIDSVVALPVSNWTVDYVTPKFVCALKNGKCVQRVYPPVLDSTKVEFESDQNPERITSSPIGAGVALATDASQKASYVWLNESAAPLDGSLDSAYSTEITGRVAQAGRYRIVLQYIQPDHPTYPGSVYIKSDAGSTPETAVASFDHCPTQSGCRTILQRDSIASNIFYIYENFTMQVTIPRGKSLLLDNALAIPVDNFDQQALLTPLPYDQSLDFINKCGKDAFKITNSSSDFCKKGVFSLSVDFNQAALPCKCDLRGSKSHECEAFGGQCPCKNHVIGRTCTECKPGFWGFPDCKPCNCPSTAYCHPRTGKCVCPPRVQGEKCDRCVDHTYGFDPILGCEECDCNPAGLAKLANSRPNLQCNLTTGECSCRASVVGRKCDQCAPGYSLFPECNLCNCELRGVTEEICNQDTGACYCKTNVRGETCDHCTPDSFNIEESNPDGCTKCFCFGTTDRCQPSSMIKSLIGRFSLSKSWASATIFTPDASPREPVFRARPDLTIDSSASDSSVTLTMANVASIWPTGEVANDASNGDGTASGVTNVYIVSPRDYLGKQIHSYGGNLTYSIRNNVPTSVGAVRSPASYDVLLVGSNITIVYEQDEQPSSANEAFIYSITLNERSFKKINGQGVTREEMMLILVNLQGIYIRASYFKSAETIVLSNLTLESAIESKTSLLDSLDASRLASRVEQCQCPKNYRGSSCEECADGYYRVTPGPYLGFCLPCQCNGHSSECDKVTGHCYNCSHNTHGDHCELCDAGYYGDATRGDPHSCMICPCPLPEASNNFADSCEVTDEGAVRCKCKPGYVEPRCDACSAGFYGNPTEIGDTCKPCECNENIDRDDPESCDPHTGECLKCLNDTFGKSCEICRSGFFGDAIESKNCAACNCDACGMEKCDHITGACVCKANVVGDQCDQCKKDHFGLNSCNGCQACNCANASLTTSCDPDSGQCSCAPGVTGRTCDTCESGYWKYSPDGCTSCNCDAKYSHGAVCDQETGQCQCLPGVVGEKCDSCPWRWVFLDKFGCRQCDECTHFLLDDTDDLKNQINLTFSELNEASVSFLKFTRIKNVNLKVDDHLRELDALRSGRSVTLVPIEEAVIALETKVASMEHDSSHVKKQAIKSLADVSDHLNRSYYEIDLLKSIVNESSDLLSSLKKLEDSLSNAIVIENIDNKVREAEALVEDLKSHSNKFDTLLVQSANSLKSSRELREETSDFVKPLNLFADQTLDLLKVHQRLWDTFNQLNNHSTSSRSSSVRTEQANIMFKRTSDQIEELVDRAARYMKEVNETNAKARIKLDACILTQTQYSAQVHDMTLNTEKLKDKNEKLRSIVYESRNLDSEKLKPFVESAKEHALKQHQESREAKRILELTKSDTREGALAAARAYTYLAENLTEALSTGQQAISNIEQSNSGGVNNDAVSVASNRSKELLQEITDMRGTMDSELDRIVKETYSSVDNVTDRLQTISSAFVSINRDLETISPLDTSSILSSPDKVISKANDLINQIGLIENNVTESHENAKSIPDTYRNIVNDVAIAQNYIERSVSSLPEAAKLIKKGELMEPNLNKLNAAMTERLVEVKRLISQARGHANRIDLGIAIEKDADKEQWTALQLRNPDNLATSGMYTKFQMSFKTPEQNGLLAYIGTPISVAVSTKKKRAMRSLARDLWLSDPLPEDDILFDSDDVLESAPSPDDKEEVSSVTAPSEGSDFMALDLVNGRVRITFDLGSGPETAMNALNVSNDAWHDVVVERIGKSVSLLVRTNDSRQEITSFSLLGSHHVFNVNPIRTAIYIAGIPEGVSIQKDIPITQLTAGSIADVFFGDTPLGLWNYAEGSNKVKPGGTKVTSSVSTAVDISNGMRFDGTSYVVLARDKFDFTKELYGQLRFKTFAREGLLFLVGKDDKSEYLAVYLSEGRVHLSFDLGSGYVIVSSKENVTLNDNEWHLVRFDRNSREGFLRVDGTDGELKQSIGKQDTLETNDKIYIGGYPGNHEYGFVIPKVDFEGCIQDLQIDSKSLDLSKNIEATAKVVPGCPEAVSREASIIDAEKSGGYIAMPLSQTANFADRVILNLKYRSPEPNGLLFYVSNDNYTSFLALYLQDGRIVLRSEPGESIVRTRNTYYGDGWHFITASKDRSRILIEVDDYFDDIAKASSTEPLQLGGEDDEASHIVYFGGVPKDTTYILEGKNIPSKFVGCFGDATLNDVFQNFATSTNRPGVSLASCPLGEVTFTNGKKTTGSGSSTSESDSGQEETVSTTTVSPVVTTEAPVIRQGCKLRVNPPPYEPEPPINVTQEGLRFGNLYDTRHEFMITPTVVSKLADESIFELEFKTSATEGVLLYLADNNHIDFAGIFLLDGKIHFSWNNGKGSQTIAYEASKLNDGNWHRAVFYRKGKLAQLSVDGSDRTQISDVTPGDASSLNVKAPLYIGGVPLDYMKAVKNNLKGVSNSFPGCIRSFKLQNNTQDFSKDSISYGSLPCDSVVESGLFISDGYVNVRDKFRVGEKITISIRVRPRTSSGVLLWVAGKQDFFILQLVNGTVKLTVDNGGGPFSATSEPESGFICDGNWYNISAVKTANIITVAVNNKKLGYQFGAGGIASTDTSGPLLMGGVPKNEAIAGLESTEPFVGCISDLVISEKPVPFHSLFNYKGDIRLNTCNLN